MSRTKRIVISVTPDEYERIKDYAWNDRVSMSQFIRLIVLKSLNRRAA